MNVAVTTAVTMSGPGASTTADVEVVERVVFKFPLTALVERLVGMGAATLESVVGTAGAKTVDVTLTTAVSVTLITSVPLSSSSLSVEEVVFATEAVMVAVIVSMTVVVPVGPSPMSILEESDTNGIDIDIIPPHH